MTQEKKVQHYSAKTKLNKCVIFAWIRSLKVSSKDNKQWMDGWTDGQFDSSLRVLHQFQAVRLWISSLVITPPLLSLMTSCQFSTIRDQCSTSTSHFYPILLERSHCLPALTAALTSAACLVPCLITIHKQYTTSGHLWAEHHIVGCIFFLHLFNSFLMFGLKGGRVTTPPGNTLFINYLKTD